MASGKGTTQTARAQQGQHDRAAILDRLRAKRPMRAEYVLPLSDEPLTELREARRELDAREDALTIATDVTLELAQRRVDEATERVAKAQAAAEADCVRLVFEGLPREAFHALLDAHQPTREEDKGKDYDPSTFPPALIAATCVEPGFDSAEEVAEVTASWNMTEREALFTTAMSTCILARVADVGKGSAATRI